MKTKFLLIFTGLFLVTSCATYKQLKPKPELTPQEQGYIELKNDDENFKLKKDKKYFIEFPAPAEANFYLVLNITNKQFINSYLTNTFDDGKGRIIEIKDESPNPQAMSVFAVDNTVQKFYWVIDLVKMDVGLEMTYRYVPQWRFNFENKYAQFNETLNKNRVDRSPVENLGTTFTFDGFDYAGEIRIINQKSEALAGIQQGLKEIEALFPVDIRNTTDEAYQNYRDLKAGIEDELEFQEKYVQLLKLFEADSHSRGNTARFIEALNPFKTFFDRRDDYPGNVQSEVSRLLETRLPEVVPFYSAQIAAKTEATRLDTRLEEIGQLYESSGLAIPADFKKLSSFAKAYNQKLDEIWTAKKRLNDIVSDVEKSGKMPSNTFFGDVLTRLSKLQYKLPRISGQAFEGFSRYTCVRKLKKEHSALRSQIGRLISEYRQADTLIPKVNAMKARKDYKGMLSLLRKNDQLGFLKDMYAGLDQLSLSEQKSRIRAALAGSDWSGAESSLRALHTDNNFLNPSKIKPKKLALVKSMEDSLRNKIEQVSVARARQLVRENLDTFQDIDALYNSPAFMPVHEMTFSTGSASSLQARNNQLKERLEELKTIDFPEQAIKNLYSQFTGAPDNNGVLKARAIVAHGKYYKGNDKKIRNRVDECDPLTAKWITRARDYRKIFVLPVSNNNSGANDYLFRMNIRIPSEAQFPVYDVNIRLPRQVAGSAHTDQWYEKISLNGDVIKNEGRFTITAPTAANDYECQITPVRMKKDADNILEIRFKHNSFKVYEVSVMAQKPIIKKH